MHETPRHCGVGMVPHLVWGIWICGMGCGAVERHQVRRHERQAGSAQWAHPLRRLDRELQE